MASLVVLIEFCQFGHIFISWKKTIYGRFICWGKYPLVSMTLPYATFQMVWIYHPRTYPLVQTENKMFHTQHVVWLWEQQVRANAKRCTQTKYSSQARRGDNGDTQDPWTVILPHRGASAECPTKHLSSKIQLTTKCLFIIQTFTELWKQILLSLSIY